MTIVIEIEGGSRSRTMNRTSRSRRNSSKVPTSATYTSLDLFSGAGGFSLGLEAAGFTSMGAIEIDEQAGKTYAKNFGDRAIAMFGRRDGDMKRVSPALVLQKLKAAGVAELDLLVAAPPCQGFSRVGRGKLDSIAEEAGAFILDPRNHLYRQAVEMLKVLKPRVFLFENVAGMLHVRGRNIAELVCAAVEGAGYRTRVAVLNSAWYGVPQSRERVIIVGTRSDLGVEPQFPSRRHSVRISRGNLSQCNLAADIWRTPEYFVPFTKLRQSGELLPAVTVGDAFADLPRFLEHLRALRTGGQYRPRRETMPAVPYRCDAPNWYCRLMREWPSLPASAELTDHYCRWTPRDFDTFGLMKFGDRYCEALEIAEGRYRQARSEYDANGGRRPLRREYIPPYPNDAFDEKWRKLDPSQPSHTITAHLGKDTYSHIHPSSREKRAITIREAARLQSFPDAFAFEGNMGEVLVQIGNAVPPLLARAIGRRLRRMLGAAEAAEEGAKEFAAHRPRRSASGM